MGGTRAEILRRTLICVTYACVYARISKRSSRIKMQTTRISTFVPKSISKLEKYSTKLPIEWYSKNGPNKPKWYDANVV